MKHLTQLSPAEAQLVLYGRKASIKELLKSTFMDLILKQALSMFEVERQPQRNDDIRIYKYIKTGQNFITHKPKPHEEVFLESFRRDRDLKILFRNIVRIGYQKSKSINEYQYLLFKSPYLKSCFYQNLFQKIFWGFQHSEKGNQLKSEIQAEIRALDKELSGNREKSYEILKAIHGNILLLTNFDFSLLSGINAAMAADIIQKPQGDDAFILYDGAVWESYSDFSGSFDSSCSGDSGCGGSGCGGCGGCGGD